MKKIVVVLIALLSVCSCHRRILEDIDMQVVLKANIVTDSLKNVTCDIYNEDIPVPEINTEAMHAIFYDTKSGRLMTEAFIQEKQLNEDGNLVISGPVSVYPGQYKMLVYDFGSEYALILDQNSYYGIKAISPLRRSAETISEQPEHLFVNSTESLDIPYGEGLHIIEVDAHSVVETYYIQIRVRGLQYVRSAKAELTTMASGKYLAGNEMISQPASSLLIDLVKSKDKSADVICNVFNTFGHFDNSENNLYVTFVLNTEDGRTVERSFNISDLFYTKNAVMHNWLLIDEEIIIDPPPPTLDPAGGLSPVVDDWEEEDHLIEL